MLQKLRLYQVGNTRSRKNTEAKQLGPQLALGWVTIKGFDVDAVATNTVKSQKRRYGASIWGKKQQMNEMLKFYEMILYRYTLFIQRQMFIP